MIYLKKSLEYAKTLNAKAIYILSAKYGLVSLKEEIEYYNETLTYIPPAKRKNDVKVLTWKEKVVERLRKISNLKEDNFIFLAGESYIKPLRKDLENIETPLKGKGIGKRLQFLNNKINKIQ